MGVLKPDHPCHSTVKLGSGLDHPLPLSGQGLHWLGVCTQIRVSWPTTGWHRWLVSSCLLVVLGLGGGCTTVPSGNHFPEATDTSDTPAPQRQQTSKSGTQLAQLQGQMLPITAEVEINGHRIGLEVAHTRQQQSIGLMFRELLADDRGMLFPFVPPRPVSFWMKNVLISLDMVFVYQGDVVAIARDVPPCEADPCPTYGPDRQLVDYVIELRGGLARELNLQPGDAIDIQWLDPSLDTAH